MKKLVAIALILAVATVANAGINFVASNTSVHPGDTITIVLKSTDQTMAGGFNIGILTDFGANGTLSAPTAFNTGLTQLGSYEILNTVATVDGTSALIYNVAAYGAQAIGASAWGFSYTVPMTAVAGQIITIGGLPEGAPYIYSDGGAYTDGGSTSANMTVGGAPTDVAIGNAVLTVVPEPMTLGLLGLGGLFLRRRMA